MNEQSRTPYRATFTLPHCCLLGLRIAPCYLYHFMRRPYRQAVPAINYHPSRVGLRRRRRDALYDAMFQLLLQCVVAFIQRAAHPATGQLLFFLSRVLASFDECFEQRLRSGLCLALDDILAEPAVQQNLTGLRAYLQLFQVEPSITDYLRQMFTDHYETYVAALKQAQQTLCFADVCAGAHFDSGIELCSLMDIAALFNGATLDARARQDFYLFGMVGKFADDWVDIGHDVRAQSPNLLHALLTQAPEELATFEKRLAEGGSRQADWWREACPCTYERYFTCIEEFHAQIQLPRVRLACDLVLLPAIIGYDYDPPRRQQAAGSKGERC
jgi:hypothetical protein